MIEIDTTGPSLCALQDHQRLDVCIFAAYDNVVTDVWSAGRHQVQDERHVAQDAIIDEYRAVMSELMSELN